MSCINTLTHVDTSNSCQKLYFDQYEYEIEYDGRGILMLYAFQILKKLVNVFSSG